MCGAGTCPPEILGKAIEANPHTPGTAKVATRPDHIRGRDPVATEDIEAEGRPGGKSSSNPETGSMVAHLHRLAHLTEALVLQAGTNSGTDRGIRSLRRHSWDIAIMVLLHPRYSIGSSARPRHTSYRQSLLVRLRQWQLPCVVLAADSRSQGGIAVRQQAGLRRVIPMHLPLQPRRGVALAACNSDRTP